ncbi:PTS galactitol transporter subunit IIA [Lentibacillus populi]|uniref:PTS galactitol transporter subunit IIA n=1 Tax=Lentibacillus populi TaxID=1827502 RepID=A0A9W5U1K6_9BACI|nr:PTS sugar transporter subunit IIA [Lentibacillus populi]MBT2216032.1 PTS sugar transporter subunit IIA [Virgibacillus dakarensis]GGB58628.1 PTS galactitol transporter subunit IIA [Lentibacillus populi]
MDYADLFDEGLVDLEVDFSSQEEIFELISNVLNDKGYVENSFKSAILKRESEFPTGLATETMKIAIPHTDVMHVRKPFIYVAKLKKPIPFLHMGTDDDWVDVENIFVLGIKEPSEQVGLLSLIMEKLQDKQFKKNFNTIANKQEMVVYLKKNFGSEDQ